MKKYLLYVEYAAQCPKRFTYFDLQSDSLLDAFFEVERILSDSEDQIYFARVLQKEGNTVRKLGSVVSFYRAILCWRGEGWHLNTSEFCEAEHTVERFYSKRYSTVWYQ